MKNLKMTLVLATVTLAAVSCGPKPETPKEEPQQEPTPKMLVLYYSQTSNTKGVAQEIATKLGADIEVDMLTAHKVFTVEELNSRCEIMLENYCKTVTIEANTMIEMAKTQIAPAVRHFAADTARDAAAKQALDSSIPCGYEKKLVARLSVLAEGIAEKVGLLEEAVIALHEAKDIIAESAMIRDTVLPKMCELRVYCDEAETLTAKNYWPFPTYGDILFSVK